jgi:4-hydroxymandelate oxidase
MPLNTTDLSGMLSLQEMEERARDSMSEMSDAYVASGAADEVTVRWNREAYDSISLRPRVLTEIESPDMRTKIFGMELPFPIFLAPTAYHKAIHPDGEIATAKGAGDAGAAWIVSAATNTCIEEIATVATAPLLFQLYVQSDRAFTKAVVQRAVAAGCRALCLTVDTPVLGARNRQTRSKFKLAPGVETPHLCDVGENARAILNPARVVLSWKDVEWIRSISSIPLVLKGILTGEDARLAVESGADGVIVSNHGGRNLDTAIATIDALPEVAESVDSRVPLLVDGGIRRGTDILKAIARGASAVLIGRPYLYGLSLGGAAGVTRVVEILRTELEMAMMLTGRNSITQIGLSMTVEVLPAPLSHVFRGTTDT